MKEGSRLGAPRPVAPGGSWRWVRRGAWETWAAGVVGAVVIASTLATYGDVVGLRSGRAQAALQTFAVCSSLVLVLLLLVRVRRTRRLKDWRLAMGISLLAVGGWVLQAGLEVALPSASPKLEVWLPAGVRLLGAGLVAFAALTPAHARARRGRILRSTVLVLAFLTVAVLVGWSLRDVVPSALSSAGPVPGASSPPSGHPLLVAALACTGLLLAFAAVEFSARARNAQDPVLWALGPASMLAAFAQLGYVFLPSLYTEWISAADVLWSASSVLLVAAATGELERYFAVQCRRAAVRTRKGLARELHDGVIQELTFLRASAATMDPVDPQEVVEACDRALAEARQALLTLSHSSERPMVSVLGASARELGRRYGFELALRLDETVTACAEATHELERIVQEAVINAARHGHATRVEVDLVRLPDGRARLTVRDDGEGFESSRPATATEDGGFGLVALRERAGCLGGTLEVRSAPGHGAEVILTWPA